jgi:hypothetical protein
VGTGSTKFIDVDETAGYDEFEFKTPLDGSLAGVVTHPEKLW